MRGPPDDDRLLLYRVRVAAAIVAVGLFIFAVVEDRDVTVIASIAGALFVLLGLVAADAISSKRNGS